MGFLFFHMISMGLRLAALRAAGAPLLNKEYLEAKSKSICESPYLQGGANSLLQQNKINAETELSCWKTHLAKIN